MYDSRSLSLSSLSSSPAICCWLMLLLLFMTSGGGSLGTQAFTISTTRTRTTTTARGLSSSFSSRTSSRRPKNVLAALASSRSLSSLQMTPPSSGSTGTSTRSLSNSTLWDLHPHRESSSYDQLESIHMHHNHHHHKDNAVSEGGVYGHQQQQQHHKELQHHEYEEQKDPQHQELSSAATALPTEETKEVGNARFLLLAAAALYGTNFSLVKMLGDAMPIGVSSTLRFGMAALATSPWLFQQPRIPGVTTTAEDDKHAEDAKSSEWTEEGKKEAWAAAIAGFEVGSWNSIGYIAQAVGLETTLASKSAFLCSLAVVTVPLLDVIVGKRLQSRQLWGAFMALVGVAFLELGGTSLAELQHWTAGDTASLLQPLAFGMGFWRMERAMHTYPNHAMRSTAAQLLAVFCGSALYGMITEPTSFQWNGGHPPFLDWLTDPNMVLALFWTGVVTTAMTVYMETLALKSLSAAETTLILSTEPIWGSVFAAAVMGERFGLGAAVGAGLILISCVYSHLGIKGTVQLFSKYTQEAAVAVEAAAVVVDPHDDNDKKDGGIKNHQDEEKKMTGKPASLEQKAKQFLKKWQ